MRSKRILNDYDIFEDGSIISYVQYNQGKLLKPNRNKSGYLTIELHSKQYKIHRLLAESFIPNPMELPMVNHKDGDKLNNKLSNLEWCSSSYNVQHAYDNNLCPRDKGSRKDSKRINQIGLNNEYIRTFSSLTEAARAVTNNTTSGCSKILQVCNKYTYNGYMRKTAFGYKWEYVD